MIPNHPHPNSNPSQPPANLRRPLSLPAVHPSDTISPATLLSSLLTLSQSILNTTTFFTQRRNAREATRQVSLLLIFLQHLHTSLLPNDAVHSLSDLHFSFQNLHFGSLPHFPCKGRTKKKGEERAPKKTRIGTRFSEV
ncbi:hypothetical protein PIB30_020134 [Stylosanthes scabra]|uniref:Uncharacterized protein n=1 Tax=Stylosanthes scabra TaxID=79078 RepID=A0ABU6Y7F1_9FABA|nr:hypothetical protein [Stylosanthes scabra]